MAESGGVFGVVEDLVDVAGDGGAPAATEDFHVGQPQAVVERLLPDHQAVEAVVGVVVGKADRAQGGIGAVERLRLAGGEGAGAADAVAELLPE